MLERKRLFGEITAVLLVMAWFVVAMMPAHADPWAGPGNLALRHDVQLLADAGLLEGPVTAWPIPWAAIAAGLASSPPSPALDPAVQEARARVVRRLGEVRGLRGLQPGAKLGVRSSPFWLRTFEDTPRESSEMRAGVSWMGDRFAFRGQATFAPDPSHGDQQWHADGSYLAAMLGNHILYVGALDRWWGPSHDDTLILSSNARPVPGIGIQRSVPRPLEHAWFSWLGPWTYSFAWGVLESDRAVPDAQLLALRVTFRPTADLEIGLTRTAQWCGQGRRCDARSFWDMVIGDSNVDDREAAAREDPANQLAAIDARWQSPFTDGPWALYIQGVAEDEARGLPSRYFLQTGLESWGTIDWRPLAGSWRAHIEYTNTLVHFFRSEPRYGVAYEHSFYRSGYRYRGRALGAAADRDSELISFGLTLLDRRERSWSMRLRYGTLNRRGTGTGHSVSQDEARLAAAQVTHRRAIRHRDFHLGYLQAGAGLQRLDERVTGDTATDAQAFIQWTWDYSGL